MNFEAKRVEKSPFGVVLQEGGKMAAVEESFVPEAVFHLKDRRPSKGLQCETISRNVSKRNEKKLKEPLKS